jgi:hypothetical protein
MLFLYDFFQSSDDESLVRLLELDIIAMAGQRSDFISSTIITNANDGNFTLFYHLYNLSDTSSIT